VGRRLHPLLLLLVVASACATSHVPAPRVEIEQISKVGRTHVTTPSGTPVDFRLDIANSLDIPVTLTSVDIETVGLSGAYTMKRVRHAFSEAIAPHGSASLNVRAWVQQLQHTDSGQVSGSVMLRGVARFDSSRGPLRTAFVGRAEQ
jgi:hypothetical protein